MNVNKNMDKNELIIFKPGIVKIENTNSYYKYEIKLDFPTLGYRTTKSEIVEMKSTYYVYEYVNQILKKELNEKFTIIVNKNEFKKFISDTEINNNINIEEYNEVVKKLKEEGAKGLFINYSPILTSMLMKDCRFKYKIEEVTKEKYDIFIEKKKKNSKNIKKK